MFLKFALRLPYRQTEGIARKLLSFLGVKVPNFRTYSIPYRWTDGKLSPEKGKLLILIRRGSHIGKPGPAEEKLRNFFSKG